MKTMIQHAVKRLVVCLSVFVAAGLQASITFDDFNVNEGHFNESLTYSGSTTGIANSTADRVTTDGPLEGTGHQQLVLNATTEGNYIRVRHLSGRGSAGNNAPFTTSAAEDGWIGVYLRTDAASDTNWTVQLWIEGAGGNNGGLEKPIIADGQWHVYEWDLDDTSGGPDGWGSVANIVDGSAIVGDGSHTIDSIVFRNATGPASTTLFMDFVAKSDSGSISNLLGDPCVATPGVLVNGPLSADNNMVRVIAVSSNATQVTVYQSTGAGGTLVAVGAKTTDIFEGVNDVTVSGLVKGAAVKATQTMGGQESCLPTDEVVVGGGANPRIRVALSMRETSGTGPVGGQAPDVYLAGGSNPNLHFLGATFRTNSAPGDGMVVYPSNDWQTLTFDADLQAVLGNASNAAGALNSFGDYAANDVVQVQVYALVYDPDLFINVYSQVGATSATVTSNGTFGVQWTWDAVPGAEGYRLLRSTNSAGFNDYAEVYGDTTFFDYGTGYWTLGNTVTPKAVLQNGPSVQWNPVAGPTNNIGTAWGTIDALAIAIDDLTDTGPYDLYIDNLQNGATVFQDFEGFVAGAQEVGFRAPSFSGSSVGLLSAPNQSTVSNGAADTGTKSLRVRFQWNMTNATQWLRLTAFFANGTPNPMVNLADPISLRMLLLPAGASPVAPPAPSLDIDLVNGDAVLDWAGTHTLQESTDVTGPYAPVAGPVTLGPYTNPPTGDARFFRLVN